MSQAPIPGQYTGPTNNGTGNGNSNRPRQNVVSMQQTASNDAQITMMEQELRRKKKNKRLVIALVVFLVVIIGVLITLIFTGVTDPRVAKLTAEVESKDLQLEQNAKRIAELKDAVEETTVSEVVPTTSLQSVEGSDVPEFFLIDGNFVAPEALKIPTASEDINNSYIQVGSKFKFAPSENWIVSVQGATLIFSHPQKIWGKIRALGFEDKVLEEDMKSTVQSFFKKYPKTTVTYRKLFLADKVVGMMGKADIKVKPDKDSKAKAMTVNVGFAQRNGYAISFMFLNDKDESVSQELIDLLLSSGIYNEDKLKLE